MIICHIIEDFHLQGILANLKQKSWWINQYKGMFGEDQELPSKYKYDYFVSLIVHSMEWSFFIMIPIYVYEFVNHSQSYRFYIYSFIINTIIHTIIDNEKANRFTINLIEDQIFHLSQILCIIIEWDIFC